MGYLNRLSARARGETPVLKPLGGSLSAPSMEHKQWRPADVQQHPATEEATSYREEPSPEKGETVVRAQEVKTEHPPLNIQSGNDDLVKVTRPSIYDPTSIVTIHEDRVATSLKYDSTDDVLIKESSSSSFGSASINAHLENTDLASQQSFQERGTKKNKDQTTRKQSSSFIYQQPVRLKKNNTHKIDREFVRPHRPISDARSPIDNATKNVGKKETINEKSLSPILADQSKHDLEFAPEDKTNISSNKTLLPLVEQQVVYNIGNITPLHERILASTQTSQQNLQSNGTGNQKTGTRIQVNIGRVDVRAITPPATPPAPAAVRRNAGISLDDYLKQREEA